MRQSTTLSVTLMMMMMRERERELLMCQWSRVNKLCSYISYSGSFPDVAPLEYISGWSVCILIINCMGVKQ